MPSEPNQDIQSDGPETVDQGIGRRVHSILWQRRIPNAAFARKIGIEQSALNRRIRGERAWSSKDVVAACIELETTPNELFGWDEGRSKPKRSHR